VATGGDTYWIGAKPNRELFSPVPTSFGSPTWSPDGCKIVFVRRLEQGGRTSAEVYVMNADGTGVKRLTHNRIDEVSAVWRPVAAP
jgi:Tol biopolymer transport system component